MLSRVQHSLADRHETFNTLAELCKVACHTHELLAPFECRPMYLCFTQCTAANI